MMLSTEFLLESAKKQPKHEVGVVYCIQKPVLTCFTGKTRCNSCGLPKLDGYPRTSIHYTRPSSQQTSVLSPAADEATGLLACSSSHLPLLCGFQPVIKGEVGRLFGLHAVDV